MKEMCAECGIERQPGYVHLCIASLRALNEQYLGQIREQAKTIEEYALKRHDAEARYELTVEKLQQTNLQIERMRNSLLVISEAWPMDNSKAWEHCVNEIHDEARRALKETVIEKRIDETKCICPPQVKCPVHPKHCDCKFHGIFVDGVCDECGRRENGYPDKRTHAHKYVGRQCSECGEFKAMEPIEGPGSVDE